MSSCRSARAAMLDGARGQANEAVLLGLEEHLDICLECREERARWAVTSVLSRYQPPSLSMTARRRIIETLTTSPKRMVSPPVIARFSWRLPLAIGFAAVAAAALIAVRVHSTHPGSGALAVNPAVNHIVTQERFSSESAGEMAFAGAQVAYRGGTSLELRPTQRTLVLERGEVDVEVAPGGPGHFRVVSSHFIIDVVGTRFIVGAWGVRTERGTVRVLDLGEHELAVVHAGESWSVGSSDGNVSPSPSLTPPVMVAPAAAPAVAPAPAIVAAPAVESISAARLIERAQAELAKGDLSRTRELLNRAAVAHPTTHDLMMVDWWRASALQNEKKYDAAIAAYRGVFNNFPTEPEGEDALFQVAQLHSEMQGHRVSAERAFDLYLSRFPDGRYATDAREYLARLHPAD